MPLLDSRRSLLLVIDVQGKLVEMVELPSLLLETSRRLLRLAGLFEIPVLLTEQYPQGLGGTEPSLRSAFDGLAGRKVFLSKTSFGCVGDPGFESAVATLLPGVEPADRQFVVAGIEAHVCVMQTVLELRRAGSEVFVAWDAVSGRGAEYRRHALDRMQQAGAALTNHESIGFEWARDKNHPRFREMSALFREGQPS